MFVPPVSSMASTKARARPTFSGVAGTRASVKGVTPSSKSTRVKASSRPRWPRMKRAASLAWRIFVPLMLPELSRTRTTSLATTRSPAAANRGEARNRKWPPSGPSSPRKDRPTSSGDSE